MNIRPLRQEHSPPLLIDANGASLAALHEWLQSEKAYVEAALTQYGALLFRGFPIADAGVFAGVAKQFAHELAAYVGGDSPRTPVEDKVYTSTELPAGREIHLHNELAYSGWWPTRLFFYCAVAPSSGGQTHIADARVVYNSIDPGVRGRFCEHDIRYQRAYHHEGGAGKSWQETFETDNRDTVERFCKASGMSAQWTDWGLRTLTIGPAVVEHPVSKEVAWFNQADLFHWTFRTPFDDAPRIDTYPPEALPFHACFGDGAEIDIEDFKEVRRAGRECEIVFDWKVGDVLILDNILTRHGRKPFTGDRRVLVAMT